MLGDDLHCLQAGGFVQERIVVFNKSLGGLFRRLNRLFVAVKKTKEDAKMIVSSLRIFVFLAANFFVVCPNGP